VTPHILTRKTRLRPRNFLINDANGLLQQYRSKADKTTPICDVCFSPESSPGVFYRASVANPAAAGFLVLFNSATLPSGGATIAPLDCVAVSFGGSAEINFAPGPPASMSSGIVVAITTAAAGCFAYTTTTGFLSGMAM